MTYAVFDFPALNRRLNRKPETVAAVVADGDLPCCTFPEYGFIPIAAPEPPSGAARSPVYQEARGFYVSCDNETVLVF